MKKRAPQKIKKTSSIIIASFRAAASQRRRGAKINEAININVRIAGPRRPTPASSAAAEPPAAFSLCTRCRASPRPGISCTWKRSGFNRRCHARKVYCCGRSLEGLHQRPWMSAADIAYAQDGPAAERGHRPPVRRVPRELVARAREQELVRVLDINNRACACARR